MNLQAKQESVAEFVANFGNSQGTYLVNYQGITCQELTSIRNKLRESGAKFAVVKNTLAKKAIADTPMSGLNDLFEGPTAVVWTGKDPVSPAKILADFKKTQDKLLLKGGFIDGAVIGPKDVEALAKMPSKLELQAKLLSLINAPGTQLVRLLNAPASSLVRLLGAWKGEIEKKNPE